MASGRAVEPLRAVVPAGGEVVAFHSSAAAERLTAPRHSIEARLERAGIALAAELFGLYEGTDAAAETLVHAGTIIGILATLAAEFAHAAAAINRRGAAPVAAGGWVLGGVADAILFPIDGETGSATVWHTIAAGARAAGLAPAELPDLHAVVAHAEATMGEKPYPVLTVASPFRPKSLLRAAAARHRHLAQALAADEGLCSPHEQALVCGAAIAHILKAEPKPAPLALLAAEAMLGAARLEPLPFAVG